MAPLTTGGYESVEEFNESEEEEEGEEEEQSPHETKAKETANKKEMVPIQSKQIKQAQATPSPKRKGIKGNQKKEEVHRGRKQQKNGATEPKNQGSKVQASKQDGLKRKSAASSTSSQKKKKKKVSK